MLVASINRVRNARGARFAFPPGIDSEKSKNAYPFPLLVLVAMFVALLATHAMAQPAKFTPPASPRATYKLQPRLEVFVWRFRWRRSTGI